MNLRHTSFALYHIEYRICDPCNVVFGKASKNAGSVISYFDIPDQLKQDNPIMIQSHGILLAFSSYHSQAGFVNNAVES